MKTFLHTEKTTAQSEDIWRLWADVTSWSVWDTEILESYLHGDFVENQTGKLKPKKGPWIDFILTNVVENVSFTSTSKLFFGTHLVNEHTIKKTDKQDVLFTHAVSFEGPAEGLFGFILGRGFNKVLPQVMRNLAIEAEREN